MLKITILGSGNFLPDTNRHCSSYLFESGKDKIIFDLGRGAIDNLIKKKIDLKKIHHIFISHMHADHFSDMGYFLGWVIDEPSFLKVEHKVKIYGPKGIKKAIKQLLRAFQIYKVLKRRPKGRIEVIELKNEDRIKINGLIVKGFAANHAQGKDNFNALSYRILYKNKAICYSGDTPDCIGIRNACKDTYLAIVEATLPKKVKIISHLNGDDLGKIASEEKIKRLIVTHIDKDYIAHVKKDIRKNYSGPVQLAKDFMSFKIK